jgi:MFS family permease
LYTAGLSGGVAGGIVISGLITIHHGWRTIYYVGIALVGSVTTLAFFTLPETAFIRAPNQPPISSTEYKENLPTATEKEGDDGTYSHFSSREAEQTVPQKKTWLQNMSLYSGTYTNEGLAKLFLRPIGLLIVPQVLWATLVMAVLVGFLVAIASNFATAFAATYHFRPYQSGLCFIAALIGSLIGIAFGGILTDRIADFFTRRNGGIREPEMRLPAIIPSMILGPLSLVLYGVGIENKLHWMVPTLGLALCQ